MSDPASPSPTCLRITTATQRRRRGRSSPAVTGTSVNATGAQPEDRRTALTGRLWDRARKGGRLVLLATLDRPARLFARLGLHGLNAVGRRLVERLTDDCVNIEVDGICLTGRVMDRGYFYRLARNESEPHMARLFRAAIGPGMVVVDVGAFVGYYTVSAGILVGPRGSVVALEPDPRNYRALRSNVARNGTAGWTVMIEAAAGDVDGDVPFFMDRWDSSQSGIGGFRPGASRTVVTEVMLDAVLKHFDQVDVIKIDTEGAEMSVLAGLEGTVARMRHRSLTVFVECFPDALRSLGSSPEALLEWFLARGFKVGLIDEDGRMVRRLGRETLPYGNLICTTNEDLWKSLADLGSARW